MILFLVVVAIFVLSVAVGSAIGAAFARLVLSGMQRGLESSRRTGPVAPVQ